MLAPVAAPAQQAVTSVNGKGGPTVTLSASDVQALSNTGGTPTGSITMTDAAQTFNPKTPAGHYFSDSVGGCAPSAGGYETQSASLGNSPTNPWVPTCSGTWVGSNVLQIPTYDVIGVAGSNGVPNTNSLMSSQFLVQSIAVATTEYQSAFTVNMDSANGTAGVNNVGITDYVRTHAFPNGNQAPSTWAFNPEIECGPTSQGGLCLIEELDSQNFDQNCGIGDTCADSQGNGGIHMLSWMDPVGYRMSAGLYIDGPGNGGSYGAVVISGAKVTIPSGSKLKPFTSDTTTLIVGCNSTGGSSPACVPDSGTPYRVGSVTNGTTLQLTQSPATQGSTHAGWNIKALSDGILLDSDATVENVDIQSGTSAYTMVQAEGAHVVAFDASSDSAPYGLTLGINQTVCFNGFDACLYFNGNHLLYSVNGTTTVIH